MPLRLSKFGEKFSSKTGILELMDDLGRAMVDLDSVLMLGGGNPAAIPAIQAIWRERMAKLLSERERFDAMLGNYDTPQGRPRFIEALVAYLNKTFSWNIEPENVAVTNGSQNAFFFLFNMLAGEFRDGDRRQILLPLMPEYIGYADQGLVEGLFRSAVPEIRFLDKRTFKYFVDFSKITVDDGIGAIAVSRPTNPTGNVLTDEEVARLTGIAQEHSIPLIVDNAYGAPFPNIIFTEATPRWSENVVLSFSLSKLGLPGTRTGAIIASKELVRALAAVGAVVNLANGNVGQEIVAPLLMSGEISKISRSIITPFYRAKALAARQWFEEFVDGSLPLYLHACEGAPFFWAWSKDLPISSAKLYERLKKRGVLVVPGHYFFYGLEEEWPHRNECLRINYSQPEAVVREGLRIIVDEIRNLYC